MLTKYPGKRLALGLLAALLLLAPEPALGQRTTATILGTVTREAAPAPSGTAVVATSIDTGAVTRAATRGNGSYTLTGLAPGQYLITVTPPGGPEVVRLVGVQVGQTVELHIDLGEQWVDVAGTETIEVVGQLSELKTSEVATNISTEQLESLPQNSRNFLSFAQLAPGVRLSTDEANKNFASGALEARHTNVFIDGVSLKNNIIQGGVVGQDASRGNPFPQGAIAGFRVLTQNFKAEYEQAGGAVISAITRSGTNQFHGDFFTAIQTRNMVYNDHFAEEREEPKPDYARYQFGGSASGPILEDQLHFFLTYEGNYQDRSSRVALGNPTPENLARFGEYEGTFGSPFREHLGFGKLTWRPSRRQNLDLSVSLRRETDIRSFGGTTSYENAENVRNNVVTSALRHQYWFDKALNEFTFQVLDSQFNPTSLNPDLVGQDFQGVIRIGGRDTDQDIVQRAFTFRDDLSLTELEWHGQHLVKTGLKLSLQKYKVERTLFGNPTFRYREDPANDLDFDVPFEAQYGVGNPAVESSNTQLGLYVQDDWQIARKLTLNVGVRWDIESNPLNNDYVTPDDVRAAAQELASVVEELNGPGFFDVENYLTDGTQRPIFWGAVQPRLGFAYDMSGKQSAVVFGGYGRYYDRTLFNTGVDERLRLQHEVRTFRFSRDGMPRDGLPTIAWDPGYLSAAGLDGLIESGAAPFPEIFLLENDTRPVRSDQFSAGVRHQLGAFASSVTFTHIRSENGVGFYPANRLASGNRNFIPTPGEFGNVLISADDRASRFTGLYFTLARPYAANPSGLGWGMSLTYTFGIARERGGDFNFDFPTIKDSPWVPTATDERHRVVISGIFGLPAELKLSTLIALGTGFPFTIADASRGFGPTEFRLRRNEGRADGLIQYKQVDMRLTREFKLHDQHRLSLFAEMFNVFNSKNFAGYDGFIPPSSGPPNPNFGKPSSVIGPPRSLQLGLSYGF
jgi:outer membrane receptor protein involved in Fe transport